MNTNILKQIILIISIIVAGYFLNILVASARLEIVIAEYVSSYFDLLSFKIVFNRNELIIFPVIVSLLSKSDIKIFLKQIFLTSLFLFIRNDLILFSMPIFLLGNFIAKREDLNTLYILLLFYTFTSVALLWDLNIDFLIFTLILIYLLTNIKNRLFEILLLVFVTKFYTFDVQNIQLLMPLFGLIFITSDRENLRLSTPWILLLANIQIPVVILTYVIFIMISEIEIFISERFKSFLALFTYTLILIMSKDNQTLQILFLGIWILELLKVDQVQNA